ATISDGKAHGSISDKINNGYLNPSAFAPAALLYPAQCDPTVEDPTAPANVNFCGTGFGNLQRNVYRGPFQTNFDFSLIKNFRFKERHNIRFSADFFNIFNHANFANPAITDVETINPSNPAASPFGKIISTVGNPRLIQFSLRYSF